MFTFPDVLGACCDNLWVHLVDVVLTASGQCPKHSHGDTRRRRKLSERVSSTTSCMGFRLERSICTSILSHLDILELNWIQDVQAVIILKYSKLHFACGTRLLEYRAEWHSLSRFIFSTIRWVTNSWPIWTCIAPGWSNVLDARSGE